MQIFPSSQAHACELKGTRANNARAKCSANFLSINHLTPIDENFFSLILKLTIFASDGFTAGDFARLHLVRILEQPTYRVSRRRRRTSPVAVRGTQRIHPMSNPLLSVWLRRSGAKAVGLLQRARRKMKVALMLPTDGKRRGTRPEIGQRVSPFEAFVMSL